MSTTTTSEPYLVRPQSAPEAGCLRNPDLNADPSGPTLTFARDFPGIRPPSSDGSRPNDPAAVRLGAIRVRTGHMSDMTDHPDPPRYPR